MATTVARLQAVLDADTRAFDRKMKSSETTTQRFGRVAKAALIGGAAAGLYAFGKAAKIGWDEYNQGAKVAAQTNAVIKSTGGVANVTESQVESLGHQLMLLSGVDDELIKSGENVLLTFTKVRNEAGKGNDIFDQATKTALDLSVALGTDLQSANIQIGKALNGSTTGLTALTRSGVSFTDQQKEMITGLFESGNALKAQKLILAELSKEFGGSAKAAGETFGGQINIARERLNNFLGDLTGKAIPYLERLAKWLDPRVTSAMETVGKFIDELRGDWRQLNAILERHQETVSKVVTVLGVLVTAVRLVARWHLFLYGTIVKVELAFLRIALTITDKVVGAIQTLISWVRRIAGAARAAAGPFITAFRIMLGPVLTIINAVQSLIDLINRIPTPSGSSAADLSGIPSPHTAPAGHRALGGPVAAMRSYFVGERGPELLTMGARSGYITPRLGGDLHLHLAPNSVIAERDLHTLIRRLDEDHRRRNG